MTDDDTRALGGAMPGSAAQALPAAADVMQAPEPAVPTAAEAATLHMVNLCNLFYEVINGLHVAHAALEAFDVLDLARETEALEQRLAQRWVETVSLLGAGGAPEGVTVH